MEEYLKTIKSLTESTRVRILALLLQTREICVSDLVEALQENQYKVSRHLKILQESDLVKGSRQGRWIYYQLKDDLSFKQTLLNAVRDISSDVINDDLKRLQQIFENKYGCNKNMVNSG